MDGWNTTFLLERPIFRGYVSFSPLCTLMYPSQSDCVPKHWPRAAARSHKAPNWNSKENPEIPTPEEGRMAWAVVLMCVYIYIFGVDIWNIIYIYILYTICILFPRSNVLGGCLLQIIRTNRYIYIYMSKNILGRRGSWNFDSVGGKINQLTQFRFHDSCRGVY